jgi:hypothetical protein
MNEKCLTLIDRGDRASMLQVARFGLNKISQGNHGMADGSLLVGHLKDCARPKLMIEITGKSGAGTVVVKLQVVNTVAELRQYGQSTLQRGGLNGNDSWRAGDFKS